MTRKPKIEGIAFDFNGVIIDDERLHWESMRLACLPSGFDLTEEEYWKRYLAYDDETAMKQIAADHAEFFRGSDLKELLRTKIEHYLELLRSRGELPLFPGVVELLRELSATYPMVIVSGARREEIELVLGLAGLGSIFKGIVAAGDTAVGKPDPAPYLKGTELLGLAPASVAAVEDSIGGVASARAAGLHTIAVEHSYPASQLGEADLVIEKIANLAEVFI